MERLLNLKNPFEISSYKENFVNEYRWVNKKLSEIEDVIRKFEAGILGFDPPCHIDILRDQRNILSNYILVLEERAEIEGIVL